MATVADAIASVPTYDKMLWPTLVALKEIGGSGTIQEIMDKVIEIAAYSENQQSVVHGGGPQSEISYRLAWARTYLKAVGAIENSSRGVWAITDYGRTLCETDMASIPNKVRAMSARRPRSRRPIVEPFPPAGTGEEAFSSTVAEDWKARLLSVLQSMKPAAFERLSQRLLREEGFTSVQVTGRSGDGGIDGIGVLRVALVSFRVLFQCKRYKGSVGASVIRDFRGAMQGRADKGLIITTGTFTAEAQKEATRDGAPVLDLIDGDALCQLLKERQLGVSTRMVEEVSIDSGLFERI